MNIFRLVGLGITGAVLSLLVKEQKPVFALCIALSTALVIIFSLLEELAYITRIIGVLGDKLSIDNRYLQIIFRIIGISYLARFGSDLCKDAGQTLLGQNIENAGKIFIMVLSFPVLLAVINLLTGILP